MKTLFLSKGKAYTRVDDADYDWLTAIGNWSLSSKGYAIHWYTDEQGRRRMHYMHRLILMQMTQARPPDWTADHINRDRFDNRRCNLRLATKSQQQANTGIRADNTSGYKGVQPIGERFRAAIQVDGQGIYLGTFDTAHEASRRYDAAQRYFNAEFAGVNHPDEPTTEAEQQALLDWLNGDSHNGYETYIETRVSGYRGVSWQKENQKWRVRVGVHGKRIHVGLFEDELEAARAYDRVAYEHLGETARLNFPPDDEADMH